MHIEFTSSAAIHLNRLLLFVWNEWISTLKFPMRKSLKRHPISRGIIFARIIREDDENEVCSKKYISEYMHWPIWICNSRRRAELIRSRCRRIDTYVYTRVQKSMKLSFSENPRACSRACSCVLLVCVCVSSAPKISPKNLGALPSVLDRVYPRRILTLRACLRIAELARLRTFSPFSPCALIQRSSAADFTPDGQENADLPRENEIRRKAALAWACARL